MQSSRRRVLFVVVVALVIGLSQGRYAYAQPSGELVAAWHVTIAPAWFDPAEAPPQITPFGMLYALHDGLVRPLPGKRMGAALAESWTESPDGLVYEFKLRQGLKFHNGDPFTAEDVQFSFERYKGAGATAMQERVERVEVVDPFTIRFHLKQPWPDFMTFYGTSATAAGLIVPKKYVERVGKDGFKKHPIGLGPYKFVSHKPGVEVVLEAFAGHWRKTPNIKRLVMKGVPEVATRLAMLKKGEAHIGFALTGTVAEGAKRDPNITLVDTRHASIIWVEFADQWDPQSVWADKRVRQAVNYALDRDIINEVGCLGFCPPAGVIVPRVMEYALQTEPVRYDPKKAKELLAGAGYPNGFDAGEFVPSAGFHVVGEAIVNNLNAVGIRLKIRPMERAAFYAAWREKKLKGLFMTGSGSAGNAATRVESFIYTKGAYAYGGYPDIDEMFLKQGLERDRARREAMLHKIQQLTIDRVMFAPVFDLRALMAVGPKVAEHTINSIPMHPFPSWEDIRLQAN